MIGSSRQRRAARSGTAYTAVVLPSGHCPPFSLLQYPLMIYFLSSFSSLHPSFLNHNLLLDLLVLGVYQMFLPWIY
ncbi:hypothetical protein F5880DRAFT_1604386 [Lentinula raphanica]|nr:hypothetical protein F5880DRAFT_1604386 [Lentinula raphanica]